MGTVKRNWTESMCLTVEEEERMLMSGGKIVNVEVTRSQKQKVVVEALARCPECETREGLRVTFNGVQIATQGEPRRTIWDVICPCGCEFTITWKESNEQVIGCAD
jgi:hypothetical protein